VLRQVDGIVCVSHSLAECYSDTKKTHVVKNNIDPSEFTFDVDERAKLRSDLGINKGEIALLFVGRLSAQKGIQEVLRYFLSGKCIAEHLIIVATLDSCRLLLLALLASLVHPRIHLFLNQPRKWLYKVYSASDIFVLPVTSFEAGSLVTLEASYNGLPVVSTDLGGIKEYNPNKELIINHQSIRLEMPRAIARATEYLKRDSRRSSLIRDHREDSFFFYDWIKTNYCQ